MTPSNPKPGEGQVPTPQPWSIAHGMNYHHIRNNSTGRYVARVQDDAQGAFDAAFIVEACSQHARLLASNAEMREALTAVYGPLVTLANGMEPMHSSMMDAIALARAALARHPEKEGI